MSKYIIELDDDIKYLIINGRADNRCYTLVRPVAELEILNSDYINEHYGQMQDEAYQKGINDGSLDVKQRVEGAYQRGLEDAWEAARKIIHMPEGDLLNIFTECYSAVCTALQVLLKYDASEAIAKLKVYEDKQKDRIEVGDEVLVEGVTDDPLVVLYKYYDDAGYPEGYCYFAYAHKGDVLIFNDDDGPIKKTGRHFKEVNKLLEAMRE